MRYPYVLFDAGDTLLGPRESFGATYARVFARHGLDLPADAFEAALRATWTDIDRSIPRGVDRYGYFSGGERGYWLRFVRETLGRLPGSPRTAGLAEVALEELIDRFRSTESWQVFQDVPPVLQELRRSGARMGVVSNWDSRLPDLLERVGLASFFEAVVVSHLEGAEKPAPVLFERGLERLGARPEETLHVGDTPELDLEGARSAGIACVLVDRRGRLDPARGASADLSGLPAIVRYGF